jgi:lambda repressor-like predicted transcriptional regulator
MTVRLLVIQLGVALLVAGLMAVPGLRRGEARGVAMDDWRVEDLMAHLRAKGLELRAVPSFEKAPLNNGAFLTTTDDPWSKLNALHTGTTCVETWRGTVSCHRIPKGPALQDWFELCGDNASCVGPFVLYGDPELRARIQAALES